ncbi:TetR/AcrR family transcriptional regulator [Ciceribacter ferrooxidans]|uniref:TetR/AcrR family transcriptional regulator n=2 Tax=Ciceribacter ferrooxidans TaxID=2509717 RepID=A0A4Q2TGR9_9HYPH|nr:TetR/AcrR family transcriptional regulator [Ciceribacter ferrooxidans]
MSEARRGRPIQYDPEVALQRARDVFWLTGFAASSLDALSAATGMNRPSLFGAFGNKEELYIATLERYRDESVDALRDMLSGAQSLRVELAEVYEKSTDFYLASNEAARGCLLIGTASVEAPHRPAVQRVLAESLGAFNAVIEARMQKAINDGEISSRTDAGALASVASAVLHSLAVRARAGATRHELDQLSKTAVELLCGPIDPGE